MIVISCVTAYAEQHGINGCQAATEKLAWSLISSSPIRAYNKVGKYTSMRVRWRQVKEILILTSARNREGAAKDKDVPEISTAVLQDIEREMHAAVERGGSLVTDSGKKG